jgi:hypothetical protein
MNVVYVMLTHQLMTFLILCTNKFVMIFILEIKSTDMTIKLADRYLKTPYGILLIFMLFSIPMLS